MYEHVLRETRETEASQASQLSQPAASGELECSDDGALLTAEILALLDAPAKKKTRFDQTIMIAGASVILFIAAESFAFGNTGLQIAIIVAVLLIHELGHLAAMKLVGYSDLSMFFIPFLGAAASGTKTSASAGQRAFVALAGPMPGIFLGLIAAVVWLLSQNQTLGYLAITLLALNLFNLLPVSPLDGGRFMETVLFSRFPTLQLVTGLAAGALLALLAWQTGDWFFGVLAFLSTASGVSRSSAWRLGHAVRPIVGHRPPAETIPVEVREPLARAMAATVPSGAPELRAKQIVGKMKLAWEHATLRPPGPAATLFALLGYGAVFATPALFGIVALVASTHSQVLATEEDGVETRILSSGIFGVTMLEVELDDGNHYHGTSRHYRYPSGELWFEGRWERGFRDGTWRGVDEKGQIVSEVTFKAGAFQSLRAMTRDGWKPRSFEEVTAGWGVEREQSLPYVHDDWLTPTREAGELGATSAQPAR